MNTFWLLYLELAGLVALAAVLVFHLVGPISTFQFSYPPRNTPRWRALSDIQEFSLAGSSPWALVGMLACIIATLLTPAASAQSMARETVHSAAFWRDICTGSGSRLSRYRQNSMPPLTCHPFTPPATSTAKRDLLFCPPDTISTETVRRIFLGYLAGLPDAADFLPADAPSQALRHAYPCSE